MEYGPRTRGAWAKFSPRGALSRRACVYVCVPDRIASRSVCPLATAAVCPFLLVFEGFSGIGELLTRV